MPAGMKWVNGLGQHGTGVHNLREAPIHSDVAARHGGFIALRRKRRPEWHSMTHKETPFQATLRPVARHAINSSNAYSWHLI